MNRNSDPLQFSKSTRFLQRAERILRCLVTWACLVIAIHGIASAGPNAGGVLVVHAQKGEVLTVGDPAKCGLPGPLTCDEIRARIDGESPARFSVLAVFPQGSSPRVAGVVFGIEYDSSIHVVDYESCGQFELGTDDWPASGEGIAITWMQAQTTLILEMCAFIGCCDGDPGILGTTYHPTQGAAFVDDSPVNDPDDVLAFGSLGFGVDGTFDCSVAGCCTGGSCRLLPESDCSGDYLGIGVTCSGSPCRVGACCYSDGSCAEVARWECDRDQGTYQGAESNCVPGLCVPTPTIESSWGLIRLKFRSPK